MNVYQFLIAQARRGKLPAHWKSVGRTMQCAGEIWAGPDSGSWIICGMRPFQSHRNAMVFENAIRVPAHVAAIAGIGRKSGRIDI